MRSACRTLLISLPYSYDEAIEPIDEFEMSDMLTKDIYPLVFLVLLYCTRLYVIDETCHMQ